MRVVVCPSMLALVVSSLTWHGCLPFEQVLWLMADGRQPSTTLLHP